MDKPNREVLSVLLDAYFNEDYEIDEANAHVVSALGKDGLATIVVDEGIGAQPFGTNDPYIEFTEKGKAFMESLLVLWQRKYLKMPRMPLMLYRLIEIIGISMSQLLIRPMPANLDQPGS